MRRLAAILAADVVGYSRLIGEDEPGTAKAATPITFNAFMSIPAGRCAQEALIPRPRGE